MPFITLWNSALLHSQILYLGKAETENCYDQLIEYIVFVPCVSWSSSKTFIRSAVQPYEMKWLFFKKFVILLILFSASDALSSLQLLSIYFHRKLQHGSGQSQAKYSVFLFIVIIIDYYYYCFFSLSLHKVNMPTLLNRDVCSFWLCNWL